MGMGDCKMNIAKTKSELVGTHYVEIAAGKHEGKHWAADSIYIDIADLEFHKCLYKAFKSSIKNFDEYENFAISQGVGRQLVLNLHYEGFKNLARKIDKMLDNNEEISFIGV